MDDKTFNEVYMRVSKKYIRERNDRIYKSTMLVLVGLSLAMCAGLWYEFTYHHRYVYLAYLIPLMLFSAGMFSTTFSYFTNRDAGRNAFSNRRG